MYVNSLQISRSAFGGWVGPTRTVCVCVCVVERERLTETQREGHGEGCIEMS